MQMSKNQKSHNPTAIILHWKTAIFFHLFLLMKALKIGNILSYLSANSCFMQIFKAAEMETGMCHKT